MRVVKSVDLYINVTFIRLVEISIKTKDYVGISTGNYLCVGGPVGEKQVERFFRTRLRKVSVILVTFKEFSVSIRPMKYMIDVVAVGFTILSEMLPIANLQDLIICL